MALESGFYKEYGLDVVPVTFTGGTQSDAVQSDVLGLREFFCIAVGNKFSS